jgi:hypothetical protein
VGTWRCVAVAEKHNVALAKKRDPLIYSTSYCRCPFVHEGDALVQFEVEVSPFSPPLTVATTLAQMQKGGAKGFSTLLTRRVHDSSHHLYPICQPAHNVC